MLVNLSLKKYFVSTAKSKRNAKEICNHRRIFSDFTSFSLFFFFFAPVFVQRLNFVKCRLLCSKRIAMAII